MPYNGSSSTGPMDLCKAGLSTHAAQVEGVACSLLPNDRIPLPSRRGAGEDVLNLR